MISTIVNMIKTLFSKKAGVGKSVKSSSNGTLYVDKRDFYSDKKVRDAISDLKNIKSLIAK